VNIKPLPFKPWAGHSCVCIINANKSACKTDGNSAIKGKGIKEPSTKWPVRTRTRGVGNGSDPKKTAGPCFRFNDAHQAKGNRYLLITASRSIVGYGLNGKTTKFSNQYAYGVFGVHKGEKLAGPLMTIIETGGSQPDSLVETMPACVFLPMGGAGSHAIDRIARASDAQVEGESMA
jgi:hypothetical protein